MVGLTMMIIIIMFDTRISSGVISFIGGLISVSAAAKVLGDAERRTSDRLARLVRQGWLQRVRHGRKRHLAPSEATATRAVFEGQ
jgi:DNA-binding transcriptional regulator PaaX